MGVSVGQNAGCMEKSTRNSVCQSSTKGHVGRHFRGCSLDGAVTRKKMPKNHQAIDMGAQRVIIATLQA